MLERPKQQFNLDRFEGPLELLLYLVQKSELDISDLPLAELTRQFLERLDQTQLPQGGDFLTHAASLFLMKSRALLPKEEEKKEPLEEDPDPRFEMLSQVIEYCRFQEVARNLSLLEDKGPPSFQRTPSPIAKEPKFRELEPLCPEELSERLIELLERSGHKIGPLLKEETSSVAEAMEALLSELTDKKELLCAPLFLSKTSRIEQIVLFLAILELIKAGKIGVAAQGKLSVCLLS